MDTPARVTRVRVIPGVALYGRCEHCGGHHDPPYSYWFAVYAYLAGWSKDDSNNAP